MASIKPTHPWLGLDLKTFLYKLGAYGKDRIKGTEGVTAAGLLMFGEEREILDEFPKYFLDYREKMTDNRWDYRITSSEGTWSGNIYDFYFKIINRITDNLNVPFELVHGIRQDDTRVHHAIREAVANAIVHADYRLERGIVIERQNTCFKFSNPGSLRISIEEAMNGGISDPRNENKIIKFIKENGFISNKVSREQFGFTKNQNTKLFKSLLAKNLIISEGKGKLTIYKLTEK